MVSFLSRGSWKNTAGERRPAISSAGGGESGGGGGGGGHRMSLSAGGLGCPFVA